MYWWKSVPNGDPKTPAELAVEQSNTLHHPPTLPDIAGTLWTINLADRVYEHRERGYGSVGSGVIMPLAVPLPNGIRRDRGLNCGQWQSKGLVFTD